MKIGIYMVMMLLLLNIAIAVPDLRLCPDKPLKAEYDVSRSGENIISTICIENKGTEFKGLLEVQRVPRGANPLSIIGWYSGQKTCDPNFPWNIHRSVAIPATDGRVTYYETTSTIADNKQYDLWLVAVSKCYFPEPVGNIIYPIKDSDLNPYFTKIGTITASESIIEPPCAESWTCSDFGDCINNYKTRTCSDANNCGTALAKPQTSQSCSEPIVDDDSYFIGKPEFSPKVISAGEPIIIKQVFHAGKTGAYLLEAGAEYSGNFLTAVGINANSCNPSETWYANKKVELNAGDHEITFTIIPQQKEGQHKIHTAYVKGECGSSNYINYVADGHITLENLPKTDNNLLYIGMAFTLLIILLNLKRRKR